MAFILSMGYLFGIRRGKEDMEISVKDIKGRSAKGKIDVSSTK